MSNILNKLKKKKNLCVCYGSRGYGKTKFLSNCKNFCLTNEELEIYKNRLYELKDLTINAISKNDYSTIKRYGNEMKYIKKVLINAERLAKKNGK